MSTNKHTATCDCGSISITLSGDPTFVNACSCRKCQRQGSGPIGMGVFFPETAIVSQQGETSTYSRTTEKGNQATRHFCPNCGSALYWFTGAVPKHIGVSWGAMDDTSPFTPSWLVWSQSLPHWLDVGDLRTFETQPG